MAILKTCIKQPADRLDYDFDYSDWLAGGDTIIAAVFAVENLKDVASTSPLVIDSSLFEPTFAKAWIVDGAHGDIYKVSCTVTTDKGRIKQDEIKIRLREY